MCGTNTTINDKPMSRLLAAIPAATLALGSLYSGLAGAQGIVLDEVIVTAQKREQTLEEVPASVSAIQGETVRDLLGAGENLRALTNRVPSLNVESSNGRTQPRFYLRGLGNIDFDNNAAQPVGMVFDEIFLESNVLRSIPVFDVQRIEVLRGPQGTLFGRNTNAGLVKIDSVRPSDDRNAYVSLGYGDRDTVSAEGAMNFAQSDSIVMRASVKYQRRSDWIDNLQTSQSEDFGEYEEFAWRLQALIDPGDVFTGLIKLHGVEMDATQPQVFYANGMVPGSKGLRSGFDETEANHDGSAGADLRHWGVAANLEWAFDAFTLTSITGYDTVDNFQFTDVDGGVSSGCCGDLGISTFPVGTGDGLDDHKQLTQELRVSNDGENWFFQGGVFILDEEMIIRSEDFVDDSQSFVDQRTDSFAFFGQYEYRPTDVFAVTAGARYTFDKRDLRVIPGRDSTVPFQRIRENDDWFSWDLAFSYDASENWNIYGRAANSSRGPVTIGRFGFVSSAKTETTNSLEFGFKSTLLEGRARWNAAIYAFRNDDQQLSATGGGANVNTLLNADGVKGHGVETDLEILFTDNLLLIANVSYNNTEIDDPDLEAVVCGSAPSCTPLDPIVSFGGGPFGEDVVNIDGNPLPRSPEWIYNVALQYNLPLGEGDFYFHTDWNYRDDANVFLYEAVEWVAESRWLGGVRIGYRSDNGYDFALVGRNITDELTVDGGIDFNNLTVFINEPAFWGVEFRKTWN